MSTVTGYVLKRTSCPFFFHTCVFPEKKNRFSLQSKVGVLSRYTAVRVAEQRERTRQTIRNNIGREN